MRSTIFYERFRFDLMKANYVISAYMNTDLQIHLIITSVPL